MHAGALGWNGFMAAGMFYWLAPRLWNTKLWSKPLANMHFWIGTVGILLYVVSMWASGINSGLMQLAETDTGVLKYPSWVEIVAQTQKFYVIRSIGGLLFISGWVLMIVNIWATVRSGRKVDGEAEVAVLAKPAAGPSTLRLVFGIPTILTVAGLGACFMMAFKGNIVLAVVGMVFLGLVVITTGVKVWHAEKTHWHWHHVLEQRPLAFTLLVALAILTGGIVEMIPGIIIQKDVPLTASGELSVKPYTALELQGRDIYVSEGCYLCHTQMIRPFRSEYLRYGEPSRIEESMWDHPFQWGSKRTGPDLARIGHSLSGGDKYDDMWHYKHMIDPRSISGPESNMPPFPWLATDKVDVAGTPGKMKALKALGVPYGDDQIASAEADYRKQADGIIAYLKGLDSSITMEWDAQLVALIAYLQRLGDNDLPERVAGK